MGKCLSCPKQRNLLLNKHIKTTVIEQTTQFENYYKLYFTKKQAITQNDPSKMFQLSLITLNQPTLSQNISTASTQISVYLQDSEFFSDQISIIMTSKAFLRKINESLCRDILIVYPSQFDIVSRRILFKCLAHAITHLEYEVDLMKLNIKNIYFYWDKDEIKKLYQMDACFINADNPLTTR